MLTTFLRRQQISCFFNLVLPCAINGKRFWIPVFLKMGMGNYFMTELWMVDVLKRLPLKEQGVFVDIGANIGQTLLKLRSVYPAMPYVGIEPNPSCVFYLHRLIRLNHFQQCYIVPVGVATTADLLNLVLLQDDEVDSSATIRPERIPSHRPIRSQWIPVLPFSIIRERLGLQDIALVKIDVEGAELDVLQSMNSVLCTDRPPILLEVLKGQESNTIQQERKVRTRQVLQEYDYSILKITPHKETRVALEPLDVFPFPRDGQDYLAIPEESAALILESFRAH